MDRTLMSRPSKSGSSSKSRRKSKDDKKKSKKKRSSREGQPQPPIAPVQDETLEDVVDNEIVSPRAPMKINKASPGLPTVIPAEEETPAAAVESTPPAGEQSVAPAAQEEEEDHDDDEEEEEEAEAATDKVSAKEVLATVEPEIKKKKGSRRGGNGDFGAAYNELYTQLCMRMLNRIYRYFQKQYSKAGGKSKKFKRELENIQQWNQGEINRRAKEILKVYPDTEAYFRYAYAANVMLMSVVVQKDEDSEDVEIEVPKFSEFILKAYVESARVLYDNAGVLDPSLPDHDKLRIREELFSCFHKAVATALRMMVPLDAIAPKGKNSGEALVGSDSESDAGSEESEDESESEESESESDEESESGSDVEESGSESEFESGSESESEASSSGDDEEESDESSDEERAPSRSKRVRASRKSLQTPDSLSIDDN